MSGKIITDTIKFVKESLENAEVGHDWWHIYRVWQNTRLILGTEKADPLICELGALLHDIADHKFHKEGEGEIIAGNFLANTDLNFKQREKIIEIIRKISFKGGINENSEKSMELKIVQDADRLDAMGAIGIARAFHYGGYKNRKIYDPEIPPVSYTTSEDYIKSDAPTINHFYEKLLLLKNLMNTETGKKLAEKRHIFMLEYLDHFFEEWGEK
jgi:uncharacterized protein